LSRSVVEDDAELRRLTVALLEDEELDTIGCESAEAALAVMLIGGQHVALVFAEFGCVASWVGSI
jgi:CheY-like chemotaxis protein